jgi:GTP cyclohydrolase I
MNDKSALAKMLSEDKVQRMAQAYSTILQCIGVDTSAPGLVDTPMRAARAMLDLTTGHREPLPCTMRVFDEPGADQMVVVGPVSFWSMCEHHALPFSGVAVVGYIPSNGKILGLSKIPRAVDYHARKLQNQERLGKDIARALLDAPGLSPLAVGVTIRARHSCMAARGPRSTGTMVTNELHGAFLESSEARAEFLAIAQRITGTD